MAVDIKQLRIGSHVEVNGERRTVFGLGCGRVSYLPHPTSSVALSVLATEVNPIPITPELLVELGFEIYSGSQIWINERMRSVTLSPLDNGEWYVRHITPTDKWQSLIVRHLNELENFIYLTLGKELIEE